MGMLRIKMIGHEQRTMVRINSMLVKARINMFVTT